MIKDGFLYLAALIFAAAVLVNLPKIFKGKKAQVFFNFAPPIVLIYLGLMLLCTMKVWDLSATSAVYKSVKNPILYAMLFIMLLRCDLKKIIKLGPKMLIGFFAATLSIGLGFFVSYAIFHQLLGAGSWKALGALCGSWMGGGGNMLAIQAALDVDEATMAYALVMDTLCNVPSVGNRKSREVQQMDKGRHKHNRRRWRCTRRGSKSQHKASRMAEHHSSARFRTLCIGSFNGTWQHD